MPYLRARFELLKDMCVECLKELSNLGLVQHSFDASDRGFDDGLVGGGRRGLFGVRPSEMT